MDVTRDISCFSETSCENNKNHQKKSQYFSVLDNHCSHFAIEVIDYVIENGIVLLFFPPHCSHELQPLDRTVYGPLKQFVGPIQGAWMRNNPGKTMTFYDLPGIIRQPWPRAPVLSYITSGFSVTGIYPFDRNIFSDQDFAPSYVTDRPNPEADLTKGTPDERQEKEKDNSADTRSSETLGESSTSYPKDSSIVDVIRNPAEEWNILKCYLENNNQEMQIAAGDGHCLLHSVLIMLESENVAKITTEDICSRLENVNISNVEYYRSFSIDGDNLANDVQEYIYFNEYNINTADLVISAICNCLGVTAIIYEARCRHVITLHHEPGRPAVSAIRMRSSFHLMLFSLVSTATRSCQISALINKGTTFCR